MEIDGGCLCGAITYEATVDPEKVVICHCTECQTHSATAFRIAVPVPKADFRLLTGTPKIYVKIAESGNRRALSFCPDCGTSLYGGDVENPQSFTVRVGTIRQRRALPPKTQIWCRSAVDWLDSIPGLRSFDTQP